MNLSGFGCFRLSLCFYASTGKRYSGWKEIGSHCLVKMDLKSAIKGRRSETMAM